MYKRKKGTKVNVSPTVTAIKAVSAAQFPSILRVSISDGVIKEDKRTHSYWCLDENGELVRGTQV